MVSNSAVDGRVGLRGEIAAASSKDYLDGWNPPPCPALVCSRLRYFDISGPGGVFETCILLHHICILSRCCTTLFEFIFTRSATRRHKATIVKTHAPYLTKDNMATTTITEKAAPFSVQKHRKANSSSISLTGQSGSKEAKLSSCLTLADEIPSVAPPWNLTGDVYFFSWWSSSTAGQNLPDHAYSPLESGAEFATSPSSRPVGGLGMVQILRYRDSPVGPYDEMLVVPGSFDWTRDNSAGTPEVGRNPRISRIYVSQKRSCYNGRLSMSSLASFLCLFLCRRLRFVDVAEGDICNY